MKYSAGTYVAANHVFEGEKSNGSSVPNDLPSTLEDVCDRFPPIENALTDIVSDKRFAEAKKNS